VLAADEGAVELRVALTEAGVVAVLLDQLRRDGGRADGAIPLVS
jgi:hypothetical protein